MNKLDIIRIMFQILCLAVFVYQTVTFLQRYHESPTIITTSQKTWDESYRPRLFICESKLFNITQSRQLGYQWYRSLLAGDVNGLDNSISWKGKYNSTWSELETLILNITNKNTEHIEFFEQINEKIIILKHLLPFAVCNEIIDFRQQLYIGLKKDVSVYLVDPHRFTNHRLNTLSMIGDNIAVPEFVNNSHSTSLSVNIKTTVSEKRTDRGYCNDYQSVTGYSKCVENGYMSLFNKVLGCVPPWFRHESNESMITCTSHINYKDEQSATEVKAQLYNINVDAQFMKGSKFESDLCLPPCQQLIYNVELAKHEKGSYDHNWINIKFAEVIDIETEINGYDSFRLIIELGSSLGLWLGLCIIGIFDLIITAVLKLQGVVQRVSGVLNIQTNHLQTG